MAATRLKIAVASSGLGHVSRGIEAWAADLARALADRGEDVTLYKGGGASEAPHEEVVPCWQRGEARTERLLRLFPPRFFWRLGIGTAYGVEQTTFAFNLIARLRRGQFDVLHVQDSRVALLAQAAWRLGLTRAVPVLAHGTNEQLAFLQRIHYLQHLAPWHLEQAREGGAWRPTWTAIPNFIDTDQFRPGRSDALRDELRIPRDAFVVVTAAAIKKEHKRIDYLLEECSGLLAAAPGRPFTLVVAGGRESDTDELVSRGQQLLGDRVRFLVRFPRQRMADLYRLADAFVLCSLREMMPIALLEATASGVPCLVNRHPIMEWMVGPGGRAIDMASRGALSAALLDLGTDPAARAELGVGARRHCLTQFSRDRVMEQILAYYAFAVHHRRGVVRRAQVGIPTARPNETDRPAAAREYAVTAEPLLR